MKVVLMKRFSILPICEVWKMSYWWIILLEKPTISILDCDGMQTVHMPNWCAPLELLVTRTKRHSCILNGRIKWKSLRLCLMNVWNFATWYVVGPKTKWKYLDILQSSPTWAHFWKVHHSNQMMKMLQGDYCGNILLF